MYRFGFTLAELLIALLILGMIATFTIPKILNSQQDSKKKSIFKEDIAALSEIVYFGWQDGSLRTSDMRPYVLNRLNAIKLCPTSPVVEGCYNATFESNTGAAVLANGSVITDIDRNINCADGCQDGIVIDYNGTLPPNVEGEDYMFVLFNYEEVGGGKVSAFISKPASLALFNEVFTN